MERCWPHQNEKLLCFATRFAFTGTCASHPLSFSRGRRSHKKEDPLCACSWIFPWGLVMVQALHHSPIVGTQRHRPRHGCLQASTPYSLRLYPQPFSTFTPWWSSWLVCPPTRGWSSLATASAAMEDFPEKISVGVFVTATMPGPNLSLSAILIEVNLTSYYVHISLLAFIF